MKTVCICGSFRHYDDMLVFRDALLARGVQCDWPTVEERQDPKTLSPEDARAAILRHLERMDRADLVFIYNKGGYLGKSVVMEIGYGYARRKPLYALSPIADQFLMSLIKAITSADEFMDVAGP